MLLFMDDGKTTCWLAPFNMLDWCCFSCFVATREDISITLLITHALSVRNITV